MICLRIPWAIIAQFFFFFNHYRKSYAGTYGRILPLSPVKTASPARGRAHLPDPRHERNTMQTLDRIMGALEENGHQILQQYIRKTELSRELIRFQRQHGQWLRAQEYEHFLSSLSKSRERKEDPFVVYQGEAGSFSEMAAIDFFGESVRARGLRQFEDSFKAVTGGEADYAVLPIENSSTGAIRQVYDLLAGYDCFITGETSVRVSQNLAVLPGTRLQDIHTVYSHEQGLFQSERFLNDHPDWRRISQPDTAGSAKMVAERGDPSKAAICSERAARIYGLEILAPSINYNSANTTRFVVVSPRMELPPGRDKIVISFKTAHKSGSLQEVLTIFTVRGLNLVRLESRPIPEHNWEYMFFVEFTGDLTATGMDDVIRLLAESTNELRIYGNIKSNIS